MIRLLILMLLIAAVSCGVSETVSPAETVVGSWKLMQMVKTPVAVEQITESNALTGRLNFKADQTFDGEIIYPSSPAKNLRVSGTYRFENGVLTIANQTNNSVTESTVKFEKDLMIAAPLNPVGLIMYLKRIE